MEKDTLLDIHVWLATRFQYLVSTQFLSGCHWEVDLSLLLPWPLHRTGHKAACLWEQEKPQRTRQKAEPFIANLRNNTPTHLPHSPYQKQVSRSSLQPKRIL
jgi:hypothetical protein